MKKLVCVALPLVLALTLVPAAAGSHSWGTYHWARTSNPFPLKVGDNVTVAWDTHLNTANTDWDQSTVLTLTTVPGTSNKRCATVTGTVQVCNGKYGNNGWLGLATIYITGGTHITQGSAKMNDTYFSMARYNNANERLHVMCQEVGHTFGLGHTSETGVSDGTCMDYFLNTATDASSTHPNQHDYDQLAAIYAELDTTSTHAPSTTGMAGRSDARPYRTRRHDHGNHTEVVEDFADGTTRITDVVWAADGPRSNIDRG